MRRARTHGKQRRAHGVQRGTATRTAQRRIAQKAESCKQKTQKGGKTTHQRSQNAEKRSRARAARSTSQRYKTAHDEPVQAGDEQPGLGCRRLRLETDVPTSHE
eukprot:356161_1